MRIGGVIEPRRDAFDQVDRRVRIHAVKHAAQIAARIERIGANPAPHVALARAGGNLEHHVGGFLDSLRQRPHPAEASLRHRLAAHRLPHARIAARAHARIGAVRQVRMAGRLRGNLYVLQKIQRLMGDLGAGRGYQLIPVVEPPQHHQQAPVQQHACIHAELQLQRGDRIPLLAGARCHALPKLAQ